MVEVNTAEQIDVKDSGIAVAYVTNNVEVEKATDLDIIVTKKEYSIVGDDIYIPQLYDDAPQWMKDLVQLVVDVSLTSGTTDLVNQLNATLSAFATSYVPLNQYTQSIISLQDADTVINSLITTLNSTYNDGISTLSGQIIELQSTKANATEVVAQVISTINSELISPTSNLNATIGSLQQTIANESSARAANFETISSTLETLDGEISGNATVTNNILTYVGIDGAGASTNTGLSAYLESNGVVGGADSQVVNGVYIEGGIPKSKWQYNSVLNVNGVYYKTGFGLSTNYVGGNGTSGSPYESEFWIDASRFKFTNSNQTGQVAPFTIDATGATPQITFNGKVSFSNVTNVPQLGSTPQEVVNAVNAGNTTTINGGKITTGSITASQINTTGLIAENINASEIVGKTITGGVINGARINGAIIKASYLDLNGELEVLTNYIISLAMYNANPSLYTDAVYIEVDNVYRIPSLSVIKEPTTTSLISYANQSLIGTMKSYNAANIGHNLKAVKIRPQITVGSPQIVFSGSYDNIVSIDDYDGNLEKYFYIPGDAFTRSRGIYAEVWFAGIKLIEAGAVRTYGGHYSAAFVRNSVTGVDIRQGVSNVGITNTVTMSTAIFDFEVYWRVGEVGAMNVDSAVLQIKLLPSDKVLGFDWTSGNGIEVRNRTTNPASLGAPYSTNYGPYTANGVLGPTIFINNMI